MPSGTLINGETLNGTFTIERQTGTTITLSTEQKYVPKLIELTVNAQSATPAFDGGDLSAKGATATFTNMDVSTTNTSGVVIATSGTATREAVLYNGAVDGWVNQSDNTQALAASSAQNWSGTTYYATCVTVGNGKTFNVVAPNGDEGNIYFKFDVANGETTLTCYRPWTDDSGNIMVDNGNNIIYLASVINF